MAVGRLDAEVSTVSGRVRRTVALLRRRGYAVTPQRLAETCLGGPVGERDVRWALAVNPDLALAEGLVVESVARDEAPAIRLRAGGHAAESAEYVAMTLGFVRTLVAVAPFVPSVSITGSLASR